MLRQISKLTNLKKANWFFYYKKILLLLIDSIQSHPEYYLFRYKDITQNFDRQYIRLEICYNNLHCVGAYYSHSEWLNGTPCAGLPFTSPLFPFWQPVSFRSSPILLPAPPAFRYRLRADGYGPFFPRCSAPPPATPRSSARK